MKLFDTDIFQLLQDDLKNLEVFFAQQAYPEFYGMDEKLRYVLNPIGKRFRASLVFLSARIIHESISKQQAESLIHAAAAVETLHNACLMHEDLLYDAALRKGKATINRIWGSDTARIIRDYLCANSFSILSELNEPEAYEVHAATVQKIVLGEAEELFLKSNLAISVNDALDAYFRVVENKTASLIAASCQLGAMLAGADRQELEALICFGLNIGIAFQIIDDILNITNAGDQSRKSGISDLRMNQLTLPVIYYLRDYKKSVADYKGLSEQARCEFAGSIVADPTIIGECYDCSMEYLSIGLSYLDTFRPSRFKNALMEISKLSLLRTS